MILRNWCSASSMPAAVQRRHMSPFCQRLTLRLMRRTVSIIDSHGFVEASVRLSRPRDAEAGDGQRLLACPRAATRRRRDAVRASSSASTRSWSSARSWSSSAHAARSRRRTSGRSRSGRWSSTFRSLWRTQRCTGVWTPKHVADGLAQRLGAVDDDQHALLDIQAALDEVRQQRGRDGGVLGRAVPQPERVLDAVGVDPERDDAAAALELDPVEHQHRQAQVARAAGSSARSGARACARRTRG